MNNILYELHFNWLSCLILLIPLLVGLGFFFCFKWYPAQNPGVNIKGAHGYVGYIFFKWLGWIVGVFCFFLFVCILVAHISDYSEKKNAIKNDQVLVVEGYVEKYHAMPFEGHDTEHFEINGVHFEYSNFELYNGYNRPACYGGVITENGQHLKIKYITDITGKNIILYIERIE